MNENVELGRVDYHNPNSTHVQIYRRINILVLAIAVAVSLAVGLTIWSAVRQDDITRTDNLQSGDRRDRDRPIDDAAHPQ